ncbi:MAG: prephenate dehydrogenase [Halanaerobium sp.]
MPKFEKIAVVGIGLIGASLAAALKKSDPSLKLTAVDRSAETIKKAKKLGIIDQGFTEIEDNLKDQDLIFIAVPVAAIPMVIKAIKEGSESRQLLVDAGSTKKEIMLQAAEILKGSQKIFIGGHPMAGSHKSGIDWHDPELFRGAPFILTPQLQPENQLPKSELKAKASAGKSDLEKELLQQLKTLIEKIGARVHIISAAEHDRCTAYLSHLPHLLSSALVNLSEKQDFDSEFFELSGSGYRDMTRIAGSSAELWQDIILSNRKNLAELIAKYIAELKELQDDLENNKEAEIYKFLARAAEIKNKTKESEGGNDGISS